MPRELAPVHYLRPNDKVWTPATVITLDTESRVVPGSDPEVLALDCWDAYAEDRRRAKGRPLRTAWGSGTSAAELAEWIDTQMVGRTSVWLYCHNLSFDLVTTRLPLHLVDRGWEISDASIGGRSPWVRMVRGGHRLALTDTGGWLPMPLDQIAALMGTQKVPLPADDADLADKHKRCRQDVAITHAAITSLMAWWDRHELGRWDITGVSSGWNAFRHVWSGERITLDPDPGYVKQDRLAIHGGRRMTTTIGEHRAGPFYELDFSAAYPTIAAELPLPVCRTRTFTSLPVDTDLVGSTRWGINARVKVTTDVPRWPVRIDRRTWYPTGTFWTELAGPEIEHARELGCLEEIGPGAVHRLGGAMMPWARWILAIQAGEVADTPPLAKAVAKHWGRAVIGRWASHGYEKIKLGPSPGQGWGFEEGWHHSANVAGNMVDLAGTRFLVAASGDPDNAYPAILAWVESYVRVRLTKAIEALGGRTVLQCDTDGLLAAGRTIGTKAGGGSLVAPAGLKPTARLHWCLDELEAVTAPLRLRVKRRAAHVSILGPQHLTVGNTRKYAGLPAMATPEPGGGFEVKLWPKLAWQMKHGTPAGYVRPTRHPIITGPFPTGWILADRSVVPVECRIDGLGNNRLTGWERSSYAAAGLVRADDQHAALLERW